MCANWYVQCHILLSKSAATIFCCAALLIATQLAIYYNTSHLTKNPTYSKLSSQQLAKYIANAIQARFKLCNGQPNSAMLLNLRNQKLWLLTLYLNRSTFSSYIGKALKIPKQVRQ